MPEKQNPASVRSQFKAHGKSVDFTGPETIDTDALECFDYQFPERSIDIITTTEEFTSVCPFSGLPDFGKLTITYTPDRKCVELRSLKYYLVSFRNVGIFYEHLANRILDDLTGIIEPKKMCVVIDFTSRGGLSTTIRAEYVKD